MPLPGSAGTSARDRTPEFQQLCERLHRQLGPASSSNGGPAGPSSKAGAAATIQQHTDFARRAAEIGHGIHKVSLKLQKLAQLAKRTSMFDDPAAEVDELTGCIKHDIQVLNSSIAELQRTHGRRKEDSKQSADHTHTVVDSLRSRLKDATVQFKDVLTVRSDNLKHHQDRRSLFSSPDAEASIPLLRPTAQHHAGGLQHSANTVALAEAAGASGTGPLPTFLQASQQQLTAAAPQDTYMASRAEALRNVESTIVELGSMFNKLSELVAEQGQVAVRIDDNMADTLTNVNEAQAQLLKYLNNISSNRWLIMKVFAVLLVFMVIFIMFIA